MTEAPPANIVELTAELVSAYVRNNSVPAGDLPALIRGVHEAMGRLGTVPEPEAPPAELKPAVPIKKSVTDDYIISLENGQKFKSLKRHLMSTYSMTPEQYREKWNLPRDYPMVAPAYAKSRSALAKSLGLGRKAKSGDIEAVMAEPVGEPVAPRPEAKAPMPEIQAAPAPKRRGRRPKAEA